MLRVFTDFNARTKDGVCWNLAYGDENLAEQAERLGIIRGDKVILYQDEDDFEVTASLDFRYVEMLGRETWVADPDWSTIKHL